MQKKREKLSIIGDFDLKRAQISEKEKATSSFKSFKSLKC